MERIFIIRLAFIFLITPLLITNTGNCIEENIDNLTKTACELQQIHNENATILSGNDSNLTSGQQTKKDIISVEIEELEKQILLTQSKINLLKELRDHYLQDKKIVPVTNSLTN